MCRLIEEISSCPSGPEMGATGLGGLLVSTDVVSLPSGITLACKAQKN